MKRNVKRLIAVVLTMVMALAMSAAAFADELEDTTASLTVEANDDNTKYTAYQVMKAHLQGYEDEAKTKPIYTYTVADDFVAFFENSAKFSLNDYNEVVDANGDVIISDAKTVGTHSDVAALATELEEYVASHSSITGTPLPASALDKGYYLVAETFTDETDGSVASAPILVDLIEDTKVTPKDSSVTLDKQVYDEDSSAWSNTSSAEFGEKISYQVKTSIPYYENNVDQKKLNYTLVDDFGDGSAIAYNKDVIVTLSKDGEADVPLSASADYTVTNSATITGEDGTVETHEGFTLSLNPATLIKYEGWNVTLTYSGTLQQGAVVDSTTGNPNTVTLTYTKNPTMEEKDDTLTDTVTTYTYGFKIHKIDNVDDAVNMKGASFKITAADGTEIGTFTYGEDGTISSTGPKVYLDTTLNYAVIEGIDEGTYTIEETQAPTGYAKLAETVKVVIKDEGRSSGSALTGIAVMEVSGQGEAENAVTTEDNDKTIDLTVLIKNTKGISLPETGSTTMMYCIIGGAIAVILGGLYFAITRRRDAK